jgi:hypothetical protein
MQMQHASPWQWQAQPVKSAAATTPIHKDLHGTAEHASTVVQYSSTAGDERGPSEPRQGIRETLVHAAPVNGGGRIFFPWVRYLLLGRARHFIIGPHRKKVKNKK